MTVLPLLAHPDRYRPCDADLLEDEPARHYWLHLFASHFEVQLAAAAETGIAQPALDGARQSLRDELDLIRQTPDRLGRLDIIVLDAVRRGVLQRSGIDDEFRLVKARENAAALAELPRRLAVIDALEPADRMEALARGMLAGNLFDMGSPSTSAHYASGSRHYAEALAAVPPRPWRFDDLDRLRDWLERSPPARVLILADNAGADVVLGVLPVARALLASGGVVTIAANAAPSLNDVTITELRELVSRARAIDPVFASSSLRLVDSGNISPLIDLTRISPELADAARGTELLILVGMGRAIESNWSATLTCACWRIAMIKDEQVTKTIDAVMGDAVCRFDTV